LRIAGVMLWLWMLNYIQGFFCDGTAYRHIFSKVKKKNICNVYYYRISDFRLVSTGTYYLVPAPIFVQKSPDYIYY